MKGIFGHLFILCLAATSFAVSQEAPQDVCPKPPFIRGLRVYAGNDETNLPVMIKSDSSVQVQNLPMPAFITIRFDVAEEMPPRLTIRFHHCDKNWNIDTDYFVRDDFFTYTRLLFYEQSAAGVDGYRWRFTNSFPSSDHPFVRFLYSGNWIFDITDENDASIIYASGRFIVAEQGVRSGLEVRNDYWTRWDMPFDQVHRLRLEVRIPSPGPIFPDYVRTVDFYRNFDLYKNYRVDSYDRQANTFVEGIGLERKTFTYENIPSGNGYRLFDLRRPAVYPARQLVRKFEGPDFTRFRFGTDRSSYLGAAVTEPLRSFDADYLCVQFELETPFIEDGDVFVAGIFNNWDPQLEDRMIFDKETGHYFLHRWLLRGAYDYQYVVGSYDEELGYLDNADWLRLEGNGWGANILYWAVIYYDDDQFGGVNRAVGFTFFVMSR
ncbi:MAG: type IX secretion system plug protein domain-containing protein [Bacteroidota bacterium]